MNATDQMDNAFNSMAYAVNYEADLRWDLASHSYTVAGWCASIAARLFREMGDTASADSASMLAHECRENAARVFAI